MTCGSDIFLYIAIFSIITQNALAGTVKPNQLESGECLNNSIDSECNYQTSGDQSSGLGQNEGPDNALQLRARLETIDRLNVKEKQIDSSRLSEPDLNLRQVLFLHRHGDRTPVQFPPKDNLATEPFWTFHGLGQLTNRGKARLFMLGKMIRERYNKFLGSSVSKHHRVTRSSGSLRCIESAQTFLAGFLRLDLPDSPDASELIWDRSDSNLLSHIWQPANVQSVPFKFDGMLAEGAECLRLTDEYENVIDKSEEAQAINKEYAKEKKLLTDLIGFELDRFYKWFWVSSLVEVERSYFPDKVKPEIIKSFDRIEEAGNRALGPFQSTLKSRRLRQGLLISEMIAHMMAMRSSSGNQTSGGPAQSKKFVHYAAHDLTLVIVLGMLDVWEQFGRRPNYASNIAIELYQDGPEWYTKFLYMEEVPSKPIELHVQRCEESHPLSRCTLDRFAALMRPYVIDSWQDWMNECGNDLTKIDPYAPGS